MGILFGVIISFIKMLLEYYGNMKLRCVLKDFSKLINDVTILDYSKLSVNDNMLISKSLDYDNELKSHKYYGTIFEYIAYRDVLKNIKLTLVDILPGGRISHRNEAIDEILK